MFTRPLCFLEKFPVLFAVTEPENTEVTQARHEIDTCHSEPRNVPHMSEVLEARQESSHREYNKPQRMHDSAVSTRNGVRTSAMTQCLGLILGLSLLVSAIGLWLSFGSREDVYRSLGDSYCTAYRDSVSCLNHCGCGFCETSSSCFSINHQDNCGNGKWNTDRAPHCQINYSYWDSRTRLFGYLTLGFLAGFLAYALLVCLWRRCDRREQPETVPMFDPTSVRCVKAYGALHRP